MSDRTVPITTAVTCVVTVGGFLALSLTGHPTDAYVFFLSGPVISGIVGIVLSRKVETVQRTTDNVKEHVNGLMSSRFDRLDEHLVVAADQAEEIASRPIIIQPAAATTAPAHAAPSDPPSAA